MTRTRIKICCISSPEEARLAVASGADALGLVGPMPSGAGVISNDLIAEIAPRIPPPVASFLLTSETRPDAIIAHVRAAGTNTVQLVDHVASGDYPALREALPGIRIVQVVHVEDDSSRDVALAAAEVADAVLLDSGRPSLPVKELGGTGRTHDWAVSRAIVRACPVPVFLAGGLRPDNVAEAIRQVRPYGVDVCSGLRTEERLDAEKVAAFVAAVAAA
ncbi:MAG: phosphoribosylanthranilate isomerase [Gemmatimonadetes bacterium]|nr:phosphoribosylanthranilate isomerase [Gemmatimonadota bacterium]